MARQMFVLHPAAPLYKRQNTQSSDATRGISTCQRTVALPIESKCACCILQYTKRKAKHSSSAMPPAASPHASGPQHCRRQDKYLCGLMPRIDKNHCCSYPNCIATTRSTGRQNQTPETHGLRLAVLRLRKGSTCYNESTKQVPTQSTMTIRPHRTTQNHRSARLHKPTMSHTTRGCVRTTPCPQWTQSQPPER